MQREAFHCEVIRKRHTYIHTYVRTCVRACTVELYRAIVRGLLLVSTDFTDAWTIFTASCFASPCCLKDASVLAGEVVPGASEFRAVDEHLPAREISRGRESHDLKLLDHAGNTHTWQRARRRIYMASYSRGRSSRQSEWVTLATITTSYQRKQVGKARMSGKTRPSGTQFNHVYFSISCSSCSSVVKFRCH